MYPTTRSHEDRQSILRRKPFILFFSASLLALIFLTPTSKTFAQCPTGWTGPYTTTITINLFCGSPPVLTPTTLTVTYCIPGGGIGPSTQYKITKVDGIPNGCTFDGQSMRDLGKEIIRKNPANFTCQGCPVAYPNWQVSWATCWEYVNNGGVLDWKPCNPSPDAEFCQDLYIVCCKCNGTLTPYYQSSTSSTDACQDPLAPNCQSFCPGPGITETVQCP